MGEIIYLVNKYDRTIIRQYHETYENWPLSDPVEKGVLLYAKESTISNDLRTTHERCFV